MRPAVLAALAFCAANIPYAAADQKLAALVECIKGQAYLRHSEGSPIKKLDPDRDILSKLRDGDIVWCDPGGSLKLVLSNGKEIDACQQKDHYHVTYSAPGELNNEQADARRKAAFDSTTETAGTPRGPAAFFFSPAQGGAVRPRDLVFRWNAASGIEAFSLAIESTDGETLWEDKTVSAAAGQLLSDSARHALEKYRNSDHEEFVLRWADEGRRPQEMRVQLLSREDEQSLDDALAFWEKQPPGILADIGRAGAYTDTGLYPEAAEEYEHALKRAPKSHDLVLAAVQANLRTGNYKRAEELRSVERSLRPAAEK